MTSEFRTTTEKDAPAIAEFLERIFGSPRGLPLTDSSHLRWKNWEPRADWSGSRGYVLTRGDAITAHATVVPLSLVSCGRRWKTAHLIDWAADPQSVGSGVALLKRIAPLADTILAVGGSEMTEKVMPAIGFQNHGQVTRFVRPLRPLRRLTFERLSIRAAARFARSMLWRWRAPRPRIAGWTATPVSPSALRAIDIPWPRELEGVALFERARETIEYLLACPVTPIRLYAAANGGAPRGYFILAFAPGQARLADFYADSARPEDWRALVQLAVKQAQGHSEVTEIVSLGSDPLTRQALAGCGFHARASSQIRLLAGKGVEHPVAPIRFQMIDSDDAYLHANQPDYWA